MLPDFSSYSEEDPAHLYLAGDEELLARADGVFIVEGQALPVHTVLLKERCGLLRRLLAAGSNGGSTHPVHHMGNGRALEVVMSDQFPPESPLALEGFTLKRVTHFLRFLYYPAEVSALDFQLPGAAKTLSACARLASALEVPQLLEVLDARMEAAVDAHQPTLQRLIDWAGVAEECGLPRLWTKCIRELAVVLAKAKGAGGVHPRVTSRSDLLLCGGGAAGSEQHDGTKVAVHDVALLQDMSPRALMAVMATLLASLRKVGGDPSHLVPAEASLAAALPALQPSGSPASEP